MSTFDENGRRAAPCCRTGQHGLRLVQKVLRVRSAPASSGSSATSSPGGDATPDVATAVSSDVRGQLLVLCACRRRAGGCQHRRAGSARRHRPAAQHGATAVLRRHPRDHCRYANSDVLTGTAQDDLMQGFAGYGRRSAAASVTAHPGRERERPGHRRHIRGPGSPRSVRRWVGSMTAPERPTRSASAGSGVLRSASTAGPA